MTAQCFFGGPSNVKPGIASLVVYGGGPLSQLFQLTGNVWLEAFAALLGTISVDTATLCITDPPTPPTLTLADVQALTSLNDVSATIAALAKVNTIVQGLAWYQLCECTSGLSPVAPTVSQPSGVPQTTTLISNTGIAGPCDTVVSPSAVATSHSGGEPGQCMIPYDPNYTQCVETFSGHVPPSPPTSLTVTTTVTTTGADHPVLLGYVDWYSASAELRTDGFSPTLGGTSTGTFTPPAGAIGYDVWYTTNGAVASSDIVQMTANAYCGGAPSTPSSACCPADQFTTGMLTQILQMVTLLQRQSVPFGYIVSTVHAGLSGDGTISVQGLIGLAISVTTLPSRAGVLAGDPNVYFSLGWVNVGTADGWFSRQELRHNPQVIFPEDMGAVTLVGYSIPADVTVSITELVREP